MSIFNCLETPHIFPPSPDAVMIQLYEFLLELLTKSANELSPLYWVGNDGEFTVLNYHDLARLWGEKRQVPIHRGSMRQLLIYYCDHPSNILSRVDTSKNFKFDLELLLNKVMISSVRVWPNLYIEF